MKKTRLNDEQIKFNFGDINKELDDLMSEGLKSYESSFGIDVNYAPFTVVISDENSRVCGAIIAYTAYAEIYIDSIWVDAAYRGKGYGKRLIQAVEDHFKGQGYNNINLVTSAFNAPGFYEKCGFTAEFTRVNKFNPKLTKTFFVKFFEDKDQTQGLLK